MKDFARILAVSIVLSITFFLQPHSKTHITSFLYVSPFVNQPRVAQEMITTGILRNFAPAVSNSLDICWVRTYEGHSERSKIVSRLGTASLLGLQGNDLSDPLTALTTPMHDLGDSETPPINHQ